MGWLFILAVVFAVVFLSLWLFALVSSYLLQTVVTGAKPCHLIVLQHGYLAPYIRSLPLLNALSEEAKKRKDNYVIHANSTNGDDWLFGAIRTNDGIDVGGKRLALCIEQLLEEYPSVARLSVIGSSLGGLYARYALRELCQSGILLVHRRPHDSDCDSESESESDCDLLTKENYEKHGNVQSEESAIGVGNNESGVKRKVQCVNFVSMATPHLGVKDWVFATPWLRWVSAAFRNWLSPTLAQLMCIDSGALIERMASESQFIEPLAAFRNVVCYANARNDSSVSFSSGSVLNCLRADGRFVETKSKHFAANGTNSELLTENFVTGIPERIGTRLFARLSSTDLKSDARLEEHCNSQSDANDDYTFGYVRADFCSSDSDEENGDIFGELAAAQCAAGGHWYAALQRRVEWRRFMCFIDDGFVSRRFAHQLLANPSLYLSQSRPIVEHLLGQFQF